MSLSTAPIETVREPTVPFVSGLLSVSLSAGCSTCTLQPLFRAWNPRVLDEYVDGALMPTHMRYSGLPETASKFEPEVR